MTPQQLLLIVSATNHSSNSPKMSWRFYRMLSVQDRVSELQIAVASGNILQAHRGSQLVEVEAPLRVQVKVRAMKNAFWDFVNSREVDEYLNLLGIDKHRRKWLVSRNQEICWDMCSGRVNTKDWRTADHVDEYAHQKET
eukprot:TRINITY_DN14765_c0_g1_i1.p2 TRINITY_DN14765_c0_g1~~TRINITY_DN14765_c0_g1_i1.p2  ORF type:complete len:140 (-),score=17.75 TRINITY_DN14765_c0_g1_i1:208-627(-)